MDRLSTELDEKIVQHLVGREASALSITSKYYRSLAEPHLYRVLTFSTKECAGLVLLLETLLDRQGLARHVRSFTLTGAEFPTTIPELGDAFYLRLWNRFDACKQIINGVVPPPSKESATRWLERMFRSAPVIDGLLAVILCLAKNLEHLSLFYNHLGVLPSTQKMVGMCWIKGRMTGVCSHGHITWELSKGTAQRADDNTCSHPHPADTNEM